MYGFIGAVEAIDSSDNGYLDSRTNPFYSKAWPNRRRGCSFIRLQIQSANRIVDKSKKVSIDFFISNEKKMDYKNVDDGMIHSNFDIQTIQAWTRVLW